MKPPITPSGVTTRATATTASTAAVFSFDGSGGWDFAGGAIGGV